MQKPPEKPKKKTVTLYTDSPNKILYEMAYRGPLSYMYQGTPEDLFFIKYDCSNDTVAHVKKIDDLPIHCPEVKDELSTIETGAVKFCSSADEYGDDEALFEEVKEFIKTYVTMEPESLTLAATYVFITWIYDRFSVVPYLRAMGSYGTGKTKLVKSVGMLSYRPMMSNGASSEAGIFRAIQQYGGTLLLDEAEFGKGDQSQAIMKILNAGNTKEAPTLRCEAKGTSGTFTLKAFQIFGPKLFSQRRPFDDKSTESRCFTIKMRHGMRAKGVPIDFFDHTPRDAEALRNKLLRWRFRNYFKYPLAKEKFKNWEPEGLEDRVLQISYPAMMLAHDKPFIKQDLIKALTSAEEEMVIERQAMDSCVLLKTLVEMKEDEGEHSLFVKSLAKRYNDAISDNKAERQMSSNKCSWLVRTILGLKTKHTRTGSRIVWDKLVIGSQLKLYKMDPLDGDGPREGDDAPSDDRPPEVTLQ